MIAPCSSKNNPKETYGSHDMAHKYYLEEAKKKAQERDRMSTTSVMPSAKSQNTTKSFKSKPRSNNQTSRDLPTSKSSYPRINAMPKADHSRNSSPFSEFKHFVCSTSPEVIALIPEVVAPEPAASTGSPSSTTADQDAPSTSDTQTTSKTQSSVISNDVEEDCCKEISGLLNIPAELLRAPTEGYAEAIMCIRTRSSSNLVGESSPNPTTSNPKLRNRRRLKKPFNLEEPLENQAHPVVTMVDQRTMAELLRAPTEGYAEAIMEDLVSKIINEFFPPSRTTNLQNEISNFEQRFRELFHEAWDRYKDLLRACPHHGFTELHQLDTFYNALNPTDQDSLNSAAGGNLLERSTQDVLTIIKNKSKVRNSRNKSIISQVKSSDVNSSSSSEIVKLTHAVNQQTSAVTTAMTAILKQFQATPPPASVKAVEEICVTYSSAHPYYQYTSYQASTQQNQVVPLSELEKIKKINDVNIKAMQAQINNVKNELRNEMQTSIQASMSNQTNELKNMMASFFQMNTASTSGLGSLPSNTVANPRGELKAITTRSGLVLDGPSVPMPPPFINPEEDERVEETLTDPELAEYTIKVPPPLVQKAKPPSQRNYVVHQRDPRHPHIPYPSRMHQEKQQEKDEVQIHKFWQMFKQLHINISLADALVLIPKYQKMLKSLLSNKEKLLELANTPLNENCSAVILKKLPEKLGDPGKFLIPCGFSELKCKALADLGASINLMPLSVWKKLGLPELISTRMTLELANREICTPVGIARDVFVPVGKFTFPADFVIVDYESDPRVPLILGRPFLRTARALIDVHGEEMILRDGDERLTLNMRHDTSSYSNQPHKESINMIDIYNVSHEEYLEDLFATNHLSGNPTSSLTSHTDLTSPEVNDDIFDPEGDIIENLLNLDKTKDLPLYHDNPLTGSTISSSPSLPISETNDYFLEEFAAECNTLKSEYAAEC
ncbi:reverse transcriptase domain-containing protein [Tanacetum coccineum]